VSKAALWRSVRRSPLDAYGWGDQLERPPTWPPVVDDAQPSRTDHCQGPHYGFASKRLQRTTVNTTAVAAPDASRRAVTTQTEAIILYPL